MDAINEREKGLATLQKVYGSANAIQIPPEGEDKFHDYVLSTMFAKIWSDETLSIKDRRLLILGAIGAQGEDAIFEIQLRTIRANAEFSDEQLKAIILMLAQYVGYPRGMKLKFLLDRVLAEG